MHSFKYFAKNEVIHLNPNDILICFSGSVSVTTAFTEGDRKELMAKKEKRAVRPLQRRNTYASNPRANSLKDLERRIHQMSVSRVRSAPTMGKDQEHEGGFETCILKPIHLSLAVLRESLACTRHR